MLQIRSKTKILRVSRTNNLVKWMHLTKKTMRNLVIMINLGLLNSTTKTVEANLIIQLTTNKSLNNLKFNLKKKDRILKMRLRRSKRVKMLLSRNKKLQLLLSRNKNHPLKKIKRIQMLPNRNKYQTPQKKNKIIQRQFLRKKKFHLKNKNPRKTKNHLNNKKKKYNPRISLKHRLARKLFRASLLQRVSK